MGVTGVTQARTPLFRLAQLSDLHYQTAENNPKNHRRVIDTLAALHKRRDDFDAILITGDLVDRSDTDAYPELKHQLDAIGKPYFVVIGNHDNRENLLRAFKAHIYLPCDGRVDWVVDDLPIKLIGLDSVLDNNSAGRLSDDSLAFLKTQLQSTDKPTIVALHHPPVAIGLAAQDCVGLQYPETLADLLAEYGALAVLCGHAHCYKHLQWAKTTVVIGASSVNTLDLSSPDKVQRQDREGGFLIHEIFPTQIKTTQIL